MILVSPITLGDEYKGRAVYIDSTEIPIECPAESICINPYWHRYKIKAKSQKTGEFIQLIAVHRHTEEHNPDYDWIFKLKPSKGLAEKQFIGADWVIYDLQVLVEEQP